MITVALNPMLDLRRRAMVEVNARYAQEFLAGAYRRQAHAVKAAQAEAVVAGEPAASAFAREAALRGMTDGDFAALVLSKAGESDRLDTIELGRQRKLIAIEAAKSPAEIDAILAEDF